MEVKRKIPWMYLPTFRGSYFESFREKLLWKPLSFRPSVEAAASFHGIQI